MFPKTEFASSAGERRNGMTEAVMDDRRESTIDGRAVSPAICGAALLAFTSVVGCRTPPPPPFTAAHRSAVLESLQSKGLDVPRVLEVTADGWVVATFEMSDAARTNRAVPLSAEAMLRLQAVREVLLPDGFTNYRVNIHGSAPDGGLGRRYGAVTLRGDRIEWVGPE